MVAVRLMVAASAAMSHLLDVVFRTAKRAGMPRATAYNGQIYWEAGMNSLLKTTTLALLITGLALGMGSVGARAVTVEDSAGNPDASAPLADPDAAAQTDTQSGGFSIIAPDQNGSGNGLQWTFGSPSMPSGTTDGQTQ
jgi:hypothetical protein